MAIISVANLKGGVGKTSLVVNVGHALAKRMGEVLIVDLDPQGDAARILQKKDSNFTIKQSASYASLYEKFYDICASAIREVRPSLSVLSISQVCSAIGAVSFDELMGQKELVADLLENLSYKYDQVIIDTPPYWHHGHELAFAISPLTIIPVDPSEMSVHAAIRLANKIGDRYLTNLLLTRTLVNRQAKRINQRSLDELELNQSETFKTLEDKKYTPPKAVTLKGADGKAKIFLANVSISRSEQVHLLSYKKTTVFEQSKLSNLQQEYLGLARDVEELLAVVEPEIEGAGYSMVENF